MTLLERISNTIEKEMSPVEVQITKCADGIMIQGSLSGLIEKHILDNSMCDYCTPEVAVEIIIHAAYSIKKELLLATGDYVHILSP